VGPGRLPRKSLPSIFESVSSLKEVARDGIEPPTQAFSGVFPARLSPNYGLSGNDQSERAQLGDLLQKHYC
jgi:hypothetical protein